jgi:hypothetical protein
VDVFDSHTKKLIWRGTDSDDLSANADKNIKKLAKDIETMFKKFPPNNYSELRRIDALNPRFS